MSASEADLVTNPLVQADVLREPVMLDIIRGLPPAEGK